MTAAILLLILWFAIVAFAGYLFGRIASRRCIQGERPLLWHCTSCGNPIREGDRCYAWWLYRYCGRCRGAFDEAIRKGEPAASGWPPHEFLAGGDPRETFCEFHRQCDRCEYDFRAHRPPPNLSAEGGSSGKTQDPGSSVLPSHIEKQP